MKLPRKLLTDTNYIVTGKLAVYCNSVTTALCLEAQIVKSGTRAAYGTAIVNRKSYYWCLREKAGDLSIFQPETLQTSLL